MTTNELKQLKHLSKEVVMCDREIKRLTENDDDSPRIKELLKLKTEILESCLKEKVKLERFITTIPDSYLRQMFEMRYIEGLSWTQLAQRIGCTGDSARMACSRYLKENKSNF